MRGEVRKCCLTLTCQFVDSPGYLDGDAGRGRGRGGGRGRGDRGRGAPGGGRGRTFDKHSQTGRT